MAKLLISTQVYENYAWVDGEIQTGKAAYWKAKGGNDYVVKKFRGGDEAATQAVMALRDSIEQSNDYFVETIIGYKIVANDYLTEFEQSQLDYEGSITYPAKELAW